MWSSRQDDDDDDDVDADRNDDVEYDDCVCMVESDNRLVFDRSGEGTV